MRTSPYLRALILFFSIHWLVAPLSAQVPQLINYQGRVAVGATNFNGSGQFAFALVNTNGGTTYWSNDGTSTAGSQPTSSVTLTVSQGLYSLLLGDTTITNMTAIPASVFFQQRRAATGLVQRRHAWLSVAHARPACRGGRPMR